ncbi:hypothetical protein EVAR_90712_1 [Eumeta japonica]|uniref:Uncharacterized protein n=1 Tax=Eumeta variegata TaxID=151549 RepID=A0A4C1SDC9_EUMVA|nr:hypothetical protein EVAR_90712_1 [Eumeta japonica]
MTLSATRCSRSAELSSPDQGRLYTWASKGARYGTSPRWCSVRAVSDTDTASVIAKCPRVRALRRGAHWRNMPGPKWRAPKCVNCTKAGCGTPHMGHSAQVRGPSKMG